MPRILDLCCCAGGASVGLARAGWTVTGVDVEPQPHYPFRFLQGDAMNVDLAGYDAYWASPPCQRSSRCAHIPGRDMSAYPDLIGPLRERLIKTGKPFVIENVPGSPLENYLVLCGSMFGLKLRRHRWFECHPPLYFSPASCNHSGRSKPPGKGRSLGYYFANAETNVIVAGHLFNLRAGSSAMGINWMNCDEMAEAVPPVYAEYIGKHLLSASKGPTDESKSYAQTSRSGGIPAVP
ncbi:MAG: hypothetical protein Q8R28_09010 [Dehalococcoidia bacterium]|nr:hypothetical protein [Dehalococcoidia bacterium]